jgi:predicted outer membrane repeat protein
MRSRLALASLLLVLGCSDSSTNAPEPEPKTIVVHADGSGDQPNIQAAIDAASDGDIVLLEDGWYQGDGNRDLDLKGKRIIIKSDGGPDNCVIDCDGSASDPHRAFRFHSQETNQTIIQGVTIEGGHTTDEGGAIRCERKTAPLFRNVLFRANDSRAVFATAASPVFDGCVFSENPGGAVSCADGSTVRFVETTFALNVVAGNGAAVLAGTSVADFTSCRFTGNSASGSGGAVRASGTPDVQAKLTFTVCWFDDNDTGGRGGAIQGDYTDLAASACSFVRNQAGAGGGAIFLATLSMGLVTGSLFVDNSSSDGAAVLNGIFSTTTLENSIVAFNRSGPPVTCESADLPRLICTDLYGNESGDWVGCIAAQSSQDGNFSADPLFCDMAADDFALRSDSPCATAGACGLVGPFGVGCSPSTYSRR